MSTNVLAINKRGCELECDIVSRSGYIHTMKFMLPFAFLFLIACQPAVTVDFDPESATEEARAMLHDYHAAMNDGGLMAEIHYLDSSDQFFWVPPGFSGKIDYDSVMTILSQNAEHEQFMKLDWQNLHVEALDNDVAIYTGTVRMKTVDDHGGQFTSLILETGTLIRRDDGWKLLCGQSRMIR